MLPRSDNRVTLPPWKKDKWGIPLPVIDCTVGPNEMKLAERAYADARAMLETVGAQMIEVGTQPDSPRHGIHEMGAARMGKDPTQSVRNARRQAHAPNLLIADGACIASSARQNPSLAYAAISARAAGHAVDLMQQGAL